MAGLGAWVAVASGGAIGSLARFWLTGAMTALTGPRFPGKLAHARSRAMAQAQDFGGVKIGITG